MAQQETLLAEHKEAMEAQEELALKAQEPKKVNQHVRVALTHLNKRREVLLGKRSAITKEIEELDAAILALE